MKDEDRKMLEFGLHFLQNKNQQFGLNTKTSLMETMLLGLQAASHVDQKFNGHSTHPHALRFAPWMHAPMEELMPRIQQAVAMTTAEEFMALSEIFVDYAASIHEPQERKKATIIAFLLGSAGIGGAPSPATMASRAPERPALSSPGPEHPSAALFSPYMDPDKGVERMTRSFNSLDKDSAKRFLATFIQYAVTLRDSAKLKVAFNLNARMYFMYKQKFEVLKALPPPR